MPKSNDDSHLRHFAVDPKIRMTVKDATADLPHGLQIPHVRSPAFISKACKVILTMHAGEGVKKHSFVDRKGTPVAARKCRRANSDLPCFLSKTPRKPLAAA